MPRFRLAVDVVAYSRLVAAAPSSATVSYVLVPRSLAWVHVSTTRAYRRCNRFHRIITARTGALMRGTQC